MLQPALHFQVDSCSYSDQGGPRAARLYARASALPDLDQLIGLLRCPLELWTPSGQLAWWGFVNAFTVQDGALSITVSLDDLANRVQVAYADVSPSASGAGLRHTTAWADDLASQAVFGVKERQLTLDAASPAQAEALRDQHLAAYSRPTLRASSSGTASWTSSSASITRTGTGPYKILITLECRGWWDTLAWRYYSAPALAIENANQLPWWQWDVGWTGVSEGPAQSITVPSSGWYATEIWLSLFRTAAVAGNVIASLCADNAGVPGSVLASGSYPGANLLTKRFSWIKFVLSPGVALSAGTYWIQASDSAPYAGSHYKIQVDEGLHYAGGLARQLRNGSDWFLMSPDADLQFRLGALLETSEQVRAMVANAGQFFTGLRLDCPSGLYTNPYRAGDDTALAEIRRHLQAGAAAGLPLIAQVSPGRALLFKAKAGPEQGPALKVGRDGVIRLPGGAPALPGPHLAGAWAAFDAPWSSTAASWGLAPGRIYLKEVAWRSAGDPQTAGGGCVTPCGPAITPSGSGVSPVPTIS